LTWDRVHLEAEGELPPHVEVWRSVRKGGDTKTRKSRRTLALPEEVVRVLIAHQERQQVIRNRALAKKQWTENGLVFCDRYGKPLSARSVRRTLAVALRIAGLPGRVDAPESCGTASSRSCRPTRVYLADLRP
jgi:hypothetical protein